MGLIMTKEELLEKFKNDFDNMGVGEIVDLAEDLGWEEESPEPNFVPWSGPHHSLYEHSGEHHNTGPLCFFNSKAGTDAQQRDLIPCPWNEPGGGYFQLVLSHDFFIMDATLLI